VHDCTVQAVFAMNALALRACFSLPWWGSGRAPTGKGVPGGSEIVTHRVFTKEKSPGQSWVDLGREYDMKAGRSRAKTEPVVTAVATLLGQIFSGRRTVRQ